MSFLTTARFDLIDFAIVLLVGLVVGMAFQALWDAAELAKQEQEIADCHTTLDSWDKDLSSIPVLHSPIAPIVGKTVGKTVGKIVIKPKKGAF